MRRFINITGACLEVDLQDSLVVAFLEGILKEEDHLGTLDEPFLVDTPTFLVVGLLDIREVAFLVGILTFLEEGLPDIREVAFLEGILTFLEEGLLGILPFNTC